MPVSLCRCLLTETDRCWKQPNHRSHHGLEEKHHPSSCSPLSLFFSHAQNFLLVAKPGACSSLFNWSRLSGSVCLHTAILLSNLLPAISGYAVHLGQHSFTYISLGKISSCYVVQIGKCAELQPSFLLKWSTVEYYSSWGVGDGLRLLQRPRGLTILLKRGLIEVITFPNILLSAYVVWLEFPVDSIYLDDVVFYPSHRALSNWLI